jgi:hypothetical protein
MEANANYRGGAQRAHNLYTETAQELGFIGLMLLLALIKSIIVNFQTARVTLRGIPDADPFLVSVVDSMQVWLLMNLIFSFASYGLSSYEWYLFAGLSVVVLRCLPRGSGNERGETQGGTIARASMPHPGGRTRVAS